MTRKIGTREIQPIGGQAKEARTGSASANAAPQIRLQIPDAMATSGPPRRPRGYDSPTLESMKLANLLTPDRIILEMTAGEHWPAIVELIDRLVAVSSLPAEMREEILEALKIREEQVSTGVGYGVAIPHAFSDKLEKVVTVFGRSKAGIDFESLDQKPVHFVILFLVPKKEYHLHLQTLAAIAKMFTNIEIRRRLGLAECPREILDIFAGRAPKEAANGAV